MLTPFRFRFVSHSLVFRSLISGVTLTVSLLALPPSLVRPLAAQTPATPVSPAAPVLAPTDGVKKLLDEAQKRLAAKAYSEAMTVAEQGRVLARSLGDGAGEAQSWEVRAEGEEGLGKLEEAVGSWKAAGALWENSGESAGAVRSLGRAVVLLVSSSKEEAKKEEARAAGGVLLARVRELAKSETKRPLATAKELSEVANGFYTRGDLNRAEQLWKDTLVIQQKLAPGSLDVAGSLNNLGWVCADRDKLGSAENYHRQALAIQQKLAPGSLDVAYSLNGLGAVAYKRNDLNKAEGYYKQALAIRQKLAPGSLSVAATLYSLGNVAYKRNGFDRAEDYYRQARTIYEKLTPGSLSVAATLYSLGNVAYQRNDLKAAEDYYRQARTIYEKLAPGSLALAYSLNGLGEVAYKRNDLNKAEGYYKQALAIRQKLAPGSLDVAYSLNDLGWVAYKRNGFDKAEDYYKQALAIQQKLAPGSLNVAASLTGLGTVAFNRGDLKAAADYHKQALAIRQKLAMGALDLTESLDNLARIHVKQKHPAVALPLLERSVGIIEAQRRTIADLNSRTLLLQSKTDTYRLLVQTHLALQQPDQALLALERARARTLADRLAEGQADFLADTTDPSLLPRQKTLDNQRSIALKSRARLDPTDKNDNAALDHNTEVLQQLDAQQRTLTADIRRASPRFAQLAYPAPPTLAQLKHAQQRLAPGDLLLEYLVDTDQTLLFALTRTTLTVYPLPVKAKDLAKLAETFRLHVAGIKAGDEKTEGKQLYTLLLRPAQAQLDRAKRLLLSPDAALHVLPFAALVETRGKGAGERYLIEAHPLLFLPSLLQHDTASAPPASPRTLEVLALGNPLYATPPAARTVASAQPVSTPLLPDRFQRMGGKLDPLPDTETQLTLLRSLYGSRAHTFRQKDATVERLLSEGGQARFIHLACHGLLDNRDPLASSLALSPSPGHPDGMLTAYELFSKGKFSAELVVLAACDTGEGKASEYEGIVGLSAAFRYAGAKNVVVSVYEIPVKSAGALMAEFYRGLKAGLGKAEALQGAQVSLLRGKGDTKGAYRAPLHWAAFQFHNN